jgi:hypothetical protein
MLLRLHLALEGIQTFGKLFDVTFTRTALQGLATEGTGIVAALAVGACLVLVQGVATDLLAAALVACAADFTSLVPVVVGSVLTRRWTQVVLGGEVGVHGVLRRRGELRLRGHWSWLSMLVLLLLLLKAMWLLSLLLQVVVGLR